MRLKITQEDIDKSSDEELENLAHELFRFVPYKFKDDRDLLKALPLGLRSLYVITILSGDVYNGGFLQYFLNYLDSFNNEIREAYKLFESKDLAALLNEAITMFEEDRDLFKSLSGAEEYSTETAEWMKNHKLNSLDQKYYDLDKDTSKRVIEIMRSKSSLFIYLGA